MNFSISSEAPAFENCTEELSKLPKRYSKKRKKKNDFGRDWKMNRVEKRQMTSQCDKRFGGKKVSGHNWLMWTCTDVNFWFCRFQISAAGWCQLVDVNLPHRCHWLFDDPRRLRHWRDAVWWPGFSWCHLTSLFHCCSLSEMSKMLGLLQWSILSSAPNNPTIQTRAKGF